jgi:hypothetical protein
VTGGRRPEGPAKDRDEPPPVGGSWGALYALVVAGLAASIAALAWLSGRWR